MPHAGYKLTNIVATNIKDAKERISSQVYILPRNQNLYVSENNLFLTYSKHVSEYDLLMKIITEIVFPRLSERKQEKIVKTTKLIERYVETLSEENQKAP